MTEDEKPLLIFKVRQPTALATHKSISQSLRKAVGPDYRAVILPAEIDLLKVVR